jgi:chemotaxis family two-component system response regulator Rcp1
MPLQVLLVEDSPGDLRLTQEAFKVVNPFIQVHVVNDGVEAMAFLKHQGEYVYSTRPDLILLDLNLPKMDGRQVLAQIKEDDGLKTIPLPRRKRMWSRAINSRPTATSASPCISTRSTAW